jgi:uncharacterized membrane protein
MRPAGGDAAPITPVGGAPTEQSEGVSAGGEYAGSEPAQCQPGENRPADPGLTKALSRLLLIGLLLAIGLMIVGAILAAVRGSGSVGRSSSFDDFPGLLAAGDPTGFLELGLLVLLATPFARVVALLVAFTMRRQWLFAAISAVVIAILALSAVLGLILG